jgi:hypothetical protein
LHASLADDSSKHALGRIDNVMIEIHITFIPVDFIIMDMSSNTSSPIILGRPFLRTTCAIIDSIEENVKFQFPHRKCMQHFPYKKVNVQKYKCLMRLAHILYVAFTKKNPFWNLKMENEVLYKQVENHKNGSITIFIF